MLQWSSVFCVRVQTQPCQAELNDSPGIYAKAWTDGPHRWRHFMLQDVARDRGSETTGSTDSTYSFDFAAVDWTKSRLGFQLQKSLWRCLNNFAAVSTKSSQDQKHRHRQSLKALQKSFIARIGRQVQHAKARRLSEQYIMSLHSSTSTSVLKGNASKSWLRSLRQTRQMRVDHDMSCHVIQHWKLMTSIIAAL